MIWCDVFLLFLGIFLIFLHKNFNISPISCFFAQKDCVFSIFSSVFEAFSAPSLRQRYLQLHPEAANGAADGAAGAAGAVAAPPSVTATELTEADHEESNDAADAADAADADVAADWKHAQNEETKPKTKK